MMILKYLSVRNLVKRNEEIY